MTPSRPRRRLRRFGRAIFQLVVPQSQSASPIRELEPDRARALAETIAEVRFAANSLPPEERKTLIVGRNSIISSRLRAEARVGERRAR